MWALNKNRILGHLWCELTLVCRFSFSFIFWNVTRMVNGLFSCWNDIPTCTKVEWKWWILHSGRQFVTLVRHPKQSHTQSSYTNQIWHHPHPSKKKKRSTQTTSEIHRSLMLTVFKIQYVQLIQLLSPWASSLASSNDWIKIVFNWRSLCELDCYLPSYHPLKILLKLIGRVLKLYLSTYSFWELIQ